MTDKHVEHIKQMAEEVLNPPCQIVSLTFRDGDYQQWGEVIGYKWDGVAFAFFDKADAITWVPADVIKTLYIEKDKNGTER